MEKEEHKLVSGWEIIAEMSGHVDELKERKGKLCARIGEIWHIVPLKSLKQND